MDHQAAHEVVIGIIALVLFVTVMVVIAGTTDTAASNILALFLALAALQIFTNGSLFQKFLSAHPVITGQTK